MRATLLATTFAAASAAQFVVNSSASQTLPLEFAMLDCVGSGHGALALRADYREHLAKVQRDINFKSIRGHGLLSDDLSTFLNGGANMFNLYSIFDFYQSVGIKPLFELSFMPASLALNASNTIMHYKGITSPPRYMNRWSDFITEIFQGLVDRYGIETVRSWRTEVWNEPSEFVCGRYRPFDRTCGQLSHGRLLNDNPDNLSLAPSPPRHADSCGFFCPPDGNFQEAYFELYNATAHAIKSVDPLIPVGGPATAGRYWVSDFVNFTKGGKAVPADYVTTHRCVWQVSYRWLRLAWRWHGSPSAFYPLCATMLFPQFSLNGQPFLPIFPPDVQLPIGLPQRPHPQPYPVGGRRGTVSGRGGSGRLAAGNDGDLCGAR